jgi:transcriptional regulator with XRE-family HTH domain
MGETATTFGAWLRQQRRQLDLTQTELAARMGYSVVTIRKLERDELRPSKQLAEQLAQHLNVEVTHRASLIAFARTPSSHPPHADAPPTQHRAK